MRILVIHQYFLAPGQPGGGGSRFNEFARLWRESGHEVTVIAGTVDHATGLPLEGTRGWIHRRDERGVDVRRCHVPGSYRHGYFGRMWAFLGFAVTGTIGAISAPRPDVIIATSPPLTAAITGAVASLWHRRPWVFEVRDLWPESAVTTGVLKPHGLLTRLLYALERIACRRAAIITVLTPAFADDLKRRHLAAEAKLKFVPNGADLEVFAPASRLNAARERYGWQDRFVALYAGAHGRANAIMQLVDAATALRDRHDIRIVSVGDGPERHACEREAEVRGLSNIQFIGPVPKDEMPGLINASDVGLAVLQNNPTFLTVYPNKVFDYMACQKPVVIAIDGIARTLVCETASAGLFAAPEDGNAIAAAVIKLRDDPGLAAALGRNGLAWVRTHADRRVLARRYLDALSTLAPQCTES
ncbi:MAG: glycosyltransferase WbuB [Chloroflexota bacterium]|nr:MAG: glycosyltransferase WbuB [Chloroflexota bacterium]